MPAVGVLHYPCPALCLERFFLDLGAQLSSPGLTCAAGGAGDTHTPGAGRDVAAGTGTKPPLPAQPAAFLLPRAVGLALNLPQGLSRAGLSFCSAFPAGAGLDELGLTLR